MKTDYFYNAVIDRVVDGDTVDMTVDLGFSVSIKERFRILNFDAPETWRPETNAEAVHGQKATLRAIELLPVGQKVQIQTFYRGKYGRYLASIVLPNGRDYATVMIEEGFEKLPSYE